MNRKFQLVLAVMAIFGILLSACGAAAATATSVPVSGAPQAPQPTAAPTDLPVGSVAINGAGATFPAPIYADWIYAFQYVDPSVALNYQPIGSGGGKKAIIDNTVDFAGSDSLVSADEYTAGVDLQMYPMVAGAVVPVYNVDFSSITNAPKLLLDRATLVGIYDGSISKWNDPAIVALNPDLAPALPNATITVVHRSDGSGTTEVFTRALSSFSETWAAAPGFGTAIEWPADKAGHGVGGKGNAGVAAAVIATPNSIGYVELAYAVSNGMPFANMINKAGTTVTANGDTLQSAMNDFANAFTDKLTNVIVDGPGANSWPISAYTYFVLHTTSMTDCVKAEKLLNFIVWAQTDPTAAQHAVALGYNVLPDAVREQVLAKLGEVTCNGNPVLGN